MDLLGIGQVNCFRTHNELTMGLLGKCPLAPSVSRHLPSFLLAGWDAREMLRSAVSKVHLSPLPDCEHSHLLLPTHNFVLSTDHYLPLGECKFPGTDTWPCALTISCCFNVSTPPVISTMHQPPYPDPPLCHVTPPFQRCVGHQQHRVRAFVSSRITCFVLNPTHPSHPAALKTHPVQVYRPEPKNFYCPSDKSSSIAQDYHPLPDNDEFPFLCASQTHFCHTPSGALKVPVFRSRVLSCDSTTIPSLKFPFPKPLRPILCCSPCRSDPCCCPGALNALMGFLLSAIETLRLIFTFHMIFSQSSHNIPGISHFALFPLWCT